MGGWLISLEMIRIQKMLKILKFDFIVLYLGYVKQKRKLF